jgi:hypothetical protein
MFEGDIIRYNLEPYNFQLEPRDNNNIITLRIVQLCCDKFIIVTPVDGLWPRTFNNWQLEEKLLVDYIIDYIYTIEPKTPPR